MPCASSDNDHSDLMTRVASSGVIEPNRVRQALCFEVPTLVTLPGKSGLIFKSRHLTRGTMCGVCLLLSSLLLSAPVDYRIIIFTGWRGDWFAVGRSAGVAVAALRARAAIVAE
jgi:hypothetical protein